MAKQSQDESELTQAATELARGLQEFDRFTESVCSEPLRSQKSIERVTKLLSTLSDVDARLTEKLQRLVAAIGHAREQQQRQADRLQARAHELQDRAQRLADLTREYGQLGTSAADLNLALHEMAGTTSDGRPGIAPERLATLLDNMKTWADSAEALAVRASSEEFPDLSRMAESLRQQLLAARNKAQLMYRAPEMPN